jgi:ribonuclease HI
MIVYTDGACSSNGKDGHEVNSTNNRMEMMAVIEALERCHGSITIISDSQYVVKGITSWIHSWKRCHWKKADGPVKNRDLWERLDALVSDPTRDVRFEWVRGHNGHPMNEMVDKLAVKASKECK